MKGPERQIGYPLGHLQLQMGKVHEAIRQKRKKTNPAIRLVPTCLVSGAHEQKHAHARKHETRQQKNVVGVQLMDAQPDEGRHRQRWDDHRVGKSQRPPCGIKTLPSNRCSGSWGS